MHRTAVLSLIVLAAPLAAGLDIRDAVEVPAFELEADLFAAEVLAIDGGKAWYQLEAGHAMWDRMPCQEVVTAKGVTFIQCNQEVGGVYNLSNLTASGTSRDWPLYAGIIAREGKTRPEIQVESDCGELRPHDGSTLAIREWVTSWRRESTSVSPGAAIAVASCGAKIVVTGDFIFSTYEWRAKVEGRDVFGDDEEHILEDGYLPRVGNDEGAADEEPRAGGEYAQSVVYLTDARLEMHVPFDDALHLVVNPATITTQQAWIGNLSSVLLEGQTVGKIDATSYKPEQVEGLDAQSSVAGDWWPSGAWWFWVSVLLVVTVPVLKPSQPRVLVAVEQEKRGAPWLAWRRSLRGSDSDWYLYGRALRMRGRHEDAARAFKRAYACTREHKAVCAQRVLEEYAQAGDVERAVRWLGLAYDLNDELLVRTDSEIYGAVANQPLFQNAVKRLFQLDD